ncbi:MAG: hypothetical protein M1820_000601 [Bogoriella megaspora]|nr:MAG: hypothetical protein M1820_000601 [Bogoriella megaspora]
MPPVTALLVVDVQVFFRPMVTSALPRIHDLLNHFSSSNPSPGLIVFTQHGHTMEELTSSPSPSQLVRKWGPEGSIAEGSEEWRLLEELTEWAPKAEKGILEGGKTGKSEKSTRMKKNTYDAFINTNLGGLLEEANIERVIVTGVMTDCCCDTTARSAFNRGYETWLVSDACGSANKRQHDAGLAGFGFAFGEVLGTREVIRRLVSEKE